MSRIIYKPYIPIPESSETTAFGGVRRANSVEAPRKANIAYGAVTDLSAVNPTNPNHDFDEAGKLLEIVEIRPKDFSAISRRGTASVISDLCRILGAAQDRFGSKPTAAEKLFTTMLEENVRRLLIVEKGRRENMWSAR
jgi:hypothetical protein